MESKKKVKKVENKKKAKVASVSKNIKSNATKTTKTKKVKTPKKENIQNINNKNIKLSKPKRKKKKRHIILIIFISLFILIFAAVMGFMLYIIITAPTFDEDALYNKEATIIYDADGEEIGRIGSEKRELVTYDELPQVLVDAIIATEDSRFFQHNGFDFARFFKASIGQLSGDSSAGGASTLTMQVVKNTFTSTESSGIKGIIRKFTDIYMAVFKVEQNYTKEEIIEFYVNAPWLGSGTYGVEQACQLYFGKSVKDLNLAEAALIAGMFQAPSTYNPINNPESAAKRRKTVLSLMVKHGYITQEEADAANAVDIESMLIEQTGESDNEYQGFIDTVIEDVIDKTGNDPYNTPMLIYSTMEKDAQDVINALYNGETSYTWKNDVVQAGIAVTSVKDGSIVAIGAGRNRVGERQFNYATMINRHPGSTAKPFFAYGPYLEYNNGNTGSIFFDTPMTYSDGTSLKNSDGSYLGMMTMTYALYRSRNIPAVQAFQQVDKEKIAEFVHNLGIDYGDTLYESAAIGGFEGMSPLSMSAAYAAFARGGYYIEPYSFTKIIYRQDDSTYETEVTKTKAMSEETAYMMNYMLTYAGSNGVGGKISVSGTDVAAKTGTSTVDEEALEQYNLPDSTSNDNWVEIYSPDYSISLWYGYKELSSTYYTTATEGANERIKISAILGNKIFKTNSSWTYPDSIVQSEVEVGTNPAEKPSSYTPSSLISKEYFAKDDAPTETSSRFSQLSNPTNGTASVATNTITLSWNGISTPNATNSSYLEEYYKEAYGDYYERYFSYFKNYNTNLLGSLGYEVYLKDSSGNLTDLGFTTDTTYTYTLSGQTSYTFVIKSTYSNYSAMASSGITINVNGTPGTSNSTSNKEDEEDELTIQITVNGSTSSNVCVSSAADELTIAAITDSVTINGSAITSYTTSPASISKEDGPTNVTYKITYDNSIYTQSKTITLSDTCE